MRLRVGDDVMKSVSGSPQIDFRILEDEGRGEELKYFSPQRLLTAVFSWQNKRKAEMSVGPIRFTVV